MRVGRPDPRPSQQLSEIVESLRRRETPRPTLGADRPTRAAIVEDEDRGVGRAKGAWLPIGCSCLRGATRDATAARPFRRGGRRNRARRRARSSTWTHQPAQEKAHPTIHAPLHRLDREIVFESRISVSVKQELQEVSRIVSRREPGQTKFRCGGATPSRPLSDCPLGTSLPYGR